jgi:hypothetical protein
LAFFAQTTASFCKNCDHNIDPRSPVVHKTKICFLEVAKSDLSWRACVQGVGNVSIAKRPSLGSGSASSGTVF